jgi:hypothetical protein
VITSDTVAREAGVPRSWLYNQPGLRAEIERIRARMKVMTAAIPACSSPSPGHYLRIVVEIVSMSEGDGQRRRGGPPRGARSAIGRCHGPIAVDACL